jgi:hypothetical protein
VSRARRNPVEGTVEQVAAALRANLFDPPGRTPEALKRYRSAVRGAKSGAEAIEILGARGMLPETWVLEGRFAMLRASNVAVVACDWRGIEQASLLALEANARQRWWGESSKAASVGGKVALRKTWLDLAAFSYERTRGGGGLRYAEEWLRRNAYSSFRKADSYAYEHSISMAVRSVFVAWAAFSASISPDSGIARSGSPFEPLIEVALLGYGVEFGPNDLYVRVPVPAAKL